VKNAIWSADLLVLQTKSSQYFHKMENGYVIITETHKPIFHCEDEYQSRVKHNPNGKYEHFLQVNPA